MPAILVCHGEPIDERDQPSGRTDGSRKVVAGVSVCLALPDEADGAHGGDCTDRRIDQEAPPPRRVLCEHATEDETDRRATSGDRAVDAERLCPFLWLGKGDRQE